MSTFPWEDLPPETADLILQALVRQLRIIEEDGNCDAVHRARLVSHTFKDAVGYLWKLNPRMVWSPRCKQNYRGYGEEGHYVQRVDFAPTFVEGVLRYTADAMAGRYTITANTYSTLYTRVYTYCTQYPPYNASEGVYDALNTVLHALAVEGALQQLDTETKRDRFVVFLLHCFKYLDKFYVKRLELPGVETVLREALVS
jgi:hypothetical protein